MMKTYLLPSTLLFFLFPIHLPNFNTPLEREKGGGITEQKKEQVAAPTYSLPANGPGKGIKEKKTEGGEYHIKTIVIDAGHGGHDSGCSGRNSVEKNIALKIAKLTGYAIRDAFPDIRVIFTRIDDTFIPLFQRAEIANKNKADLFISIHCNAVSSNQSIIKGTETYVLGLHKAEENLEVAKRENAAILLEDNYENIYGFDPNSAEAHIVLSMVQNAYLEQSILFAQKVEENIKEGGQEHSRGVKQAGFLVLAQTTMPSVLVETGFLTNHHDENFLRTENGQKHVAKAIFDAFRQYKRGVETGIPAPVSMPVKMSKIDHFKKVNEAEEKPPKKPKMVISTEIQSKNISAKPTTDLPKIVPLKPVTAAAPPAEPAVQFRVQLAASVNEIDIKKGRWTRVPFPIEVIREGGYFKYQARAFESLQEASRAKKIIRQKGFYDAFIVAYKNEKKVKIGQ